MSSLGARIVVAASGAARRMGYVIVVIVVVLLLQLMVLDQKMPIKCFVDFKLLMRRSVSYRMMILLYNVRKKTFM